MEGHNVIFVWLVRIFYLKGQREVGRERSMVVEGEYDKSISTKDERSVRYEQIQEIT